MGNLRSVLNALEHLGARLRGRRLAAGGVATPRSSSCPGSARSARRCGASSERGFAAGAAATRRGRAGRSSASASACSCSASRHEFGEHRGLGLIPGVGRANRRRRALRVPHMGWNDLAVEAAEHADSTASPAEPTFYFVHSYEFRPARPDDADRDHRLRRRGHRDRQRGKSSASSSTPRRARTTGSAAAQFVAL